MVAGFATQPSQIEEVPFTRAQFVNNVYFALYIEHSAQNRDPGSFFPPSEEVLKKLKEVPTEVKRDMTRMMSKCWDEKDLTPQDKDKFRDYVKEKSGRIAFCESVNEYRKNGLFSMRTKAYAKVTELMLYVLNQLTKEDDLDVAQRLLILSQTFYKEEKTGEGDMEKVFLQQSVQKHPFWHNPEFWAKVIRAPMNTEERPPIGETEEERKAREETEEFVKASTYALNMVNFEVDQKVLDQVILPYAISKGVSKRHLDLIKALVFVIP